VKTQTARGEKKSAAAKRRIAISLTDEELKHVEEVAKRFAMKDAAFCGYCVKFYLSHFGGDATLKRLAEDDQPRLSL
jgi:hypothetical protein